MCVSSARAATGGPTPANIKTKPIKPHRSGIKVAVKRQLSLRPQLRMEEWESRGHGGDPAFCPKCPLTSRQWETPCFPRVERQRASVSAPFAGAAATVVPSRGTDCTTAWYYQYHGLVLFVPRRGSLPWLWIHRQGNCLPIPCLCCVERAWACRFTGRWPFACLPSLVFRMESKGRLLFRACRSGRRITQD